MSAPIKKYSAFKRSQPMHKSATTKQPANFKYNPEMFPSWMTHDVQSIVVIDETKSFKSRFNNDILTKEDANKAELPAGWIQAQLPTCKPRLRRQNLPQQMDDSAFCFAKMDELVDKWALYRQNYVELYGIDIYNKMYGVYNISIIE